MHFFSRHRLESQRGGAVVEFALILPLLLLLLFGIVEFSLLMYNKQIITNASREGARYGIVVRESGARASIAEIRKIVKNWAAQRLVTFGDDTLEDDRITVEACDNRVAGNCDDLTDDTKWKNLNVTNAPFGYQLKVSIDYDYGFLLVPHIPLLGTENNLPISISLNAETVMNYE